MTWLAVAQAGSITRYSKAWLVEINSLGYGTVKAGGALADMRDLADVLNGEKNR